MCCSAFPANRRHESRKLIFCLDTFFATLRIANSFLKFIPQDDCGIPLLHQAHVVRWNLHISVGKPEKQGQHRNVWKADGRLGECSWLRVETATDPCRRTVADSNPCHALCPCDGQADYLGPRWPRY